jgi:hypothetical protein
MKKKLSWSEIDRRIIDYPDAGMTALLIGAGQGAYEIASSSPVLGSILISSGCISFLASRIVMNATFDAMEEANALPKTEIVSHRPKPIDYLRGIGLAALTYGFANELVAVPSRSVVRMLAGMATSVLGVTAIGVGTHFRPDTLDGQDDVVNAEALQVVSDLLE